MESGPNSNADREASLRRIAIVLSSLPATVSQDLMSSLAPASRSAISRAISTLSDVDPLEQRRAYQAFRVSIQRNQFSSPDSQSMAKRPGADSPVNDTTQPSDDPIGSRVVSRERVKIPADTSGNATESPSSSDAPMSFLDDVEESLLLNLLTGEHPQTIAVVLASVSPQKAGRVLPQLTARTQTETLSRIGRLDRLPESAITEIAEHFQERIRQHQARSSDKRGRSALNAILANMPDRVGSFRGHSDAAVGQSNFAPHSPNSNPTDSLTSASTSGEIEHRSEEFPSMDKATRELATKLQIAEHPRTVDPEPTSIRREPTNRGSDARYDDTNDHWLASTDGIARRLETMPPAELCAALGRVETRVAMLALCGLPNRVCESALAQLPRAEAKKVRSAMTSLGSMNLRDIDDAKEAVARASTQIDQRYPVAA